jgi:bacterioferritin-associated ferredoxin
MRAQIANGARTAGDIFRANGCAPQCGSCVPYVKDLLGQARSTGAAENSVPAMAAE